MMKRIMIMKREVPVNGKRRNAGFTLAELLIVVAIIAILMAIALPVFSGQLERARDAADAANLRAGYSEAQIKILNFDSSTAKPSGEYNDDGVMVDDYGAVRQIKTTMSYHVQSSDAAWEGQTDPERSLGIIGTKAPGYDGPIVFIISDPFNSPGDIDIWYWDGTGSDGKALFNP